MSRTVSSVNLLKIFDDNHSEFQLIWLGSSWFDFFHPREQNNPFNVNEQHSNTASPSVPRLMEEGHVFQKSILPLTYYNHQTKPNWWTFFKDRNLKLSSSSRGAHYVHVSYREMCFIRWRCSVISLYLPVRSMSHTDPWSLPLDMIACSLASYISLGSVPAAVVYYCPQNSIFPVEVKKAPIADKTCIHTTIKGISKKPCKFKDWYPRNILLK